VNAFKNRLYFLEADSQDFWYADPAAITGTVTKFPLSRVGQFGGNLIAMGTWTHDGGDGVDDYAVFIMSSGDVVVYSGSDPSDATDFLLVGVYHIGVPLGVRGVVKVGGDLLVMTTQDYVSLSSVLSTGQLGNASKLSGAVIDAANAGASLYGWSATIHNKGQMIVFNVPNANGTYHQHVINTITNAPCRFTGIDARCWGVFDDELYFGSTDGAVYKLGGQTDAGNAIEADGRQAWFNLDDRSARITAARPVLSTVGSLAFNFGIGQDYQDALTPPPVAVGVTTSPWDTSAWDVTPWVAEEQIDIGWDVAVAYGESFSPRIRISSSLEAAWLRTDYRAEKGVNF